MGRITIQETFVWEFAGTYPDVPTADGVDIEELTRGDSEPMFVTLPVGKSGVISANGRYYDDEFQRELMRQVITQRPAGNMGHLADSDRDSVYRVSDVDWLGAMQADGLTWGKAYVPPGAVREFVRRRKALNAQIATSIYGTGEAEWDESIQAWRISAFELEQIDLVPPQRAGVRDLAAVPKVTSEMAGQADPPGTDESEDSMNREEIIKAMTAADVALLPEAVVETIQAQARGGVAEIGQMQAVREALGLDAQGDVVAAIRELRDAVAQQAKAAIGAEIIRVVGEIVKADDEAGTAKATVIELVQASAPETVEGVRPAVEAVLGREHVKAMLQAYVQAEMGPAQRRPLGQHQANGGDTPYVTIPAVE